MLQGVRNDSRQHKCHTDTVIRAEGSALSFDKAGHYTVEISYRNKSVLKEVDGTVDMKDVFAAICAILG